MRPSGTLILPAPARRTTIVRRCLIGVVGLALGGCSAPGLALFAGLNAASLNAVGKTVPDIAVSMATQKDCRLIHLKYGKDYCRDLMAEAMAQAMKPAETCFRSLGQIQCYASEHDPFGTREDSVQ